MTVGFFNGTTSLFEARRDKYIHDVFASPLRWWEINAALVTGAWSGASIVGAGVLAIALPLTRTAGRGPARSCSCSARSACWWWRRRSA